MTDRTPRTTERLQPSDLARAAEILLAGGLVAFPTETVYGLGADATNESAVRAVFAAKGRPEGHPLIVHVADRQAADEWIDEADPRVLALAAAFWPGPLTLVVPSSGRAAPAVTGRRSTVGIRVPDHPVAAGLLHEVGTGLAAPSANRFGHVSPTTADHVVADLDGRIDAVIDGGPCAVGLESTIVELVGERAVLLRPGGVSRPEIEAVLGDQLIDGTSGPSRAPGMLVSHYSPSAPVRVVEPDASLTGVGPDVAVIAPHPVSQRLGWQLPADADGYAAGLYRTLRAADAAAPAQIVIVPPSAGRLLEAVLDRLARAAGPTGGSPSPPASAESTLDP